MIKKIIRYQKVFKNKELYAQELKEQVLLNNWKTIKIHNCTIYNDLLDNGYLFRYGLNNENTPLPIYEIREFIGIPMEFFKELDITFTTFTHAKGYNNSLCIYKA
jgi:hypothetical protein